MGSSWIRGSLLGAGAFGQVNLAMDRVTGAFFAVKSTVVSCSSSYQQGDVEDVVGAAVQPNSNLAAMENEIRILQELDSEFVVRCLGSDWSEEGGKRMRNLFLEYMPGGSLSDVLKQFAGGAQQQQQPLDEQLIRSYTRSILQGIDYLHRRGIVHCDIKGKNVLVGNAGSVKLADFGSAKHVEEEEEVADCRRTTGEDAAAASERRRGRTGGDGLKQDQVTMELEEDCSVRKVKGTPLWMAPEVVLQKEQGLPSDIWSLGCTVVEMATGRAPWAHIADPFVALYRIGCTNEMPSVPASLSPEAHDFLARCFERNPRTRWTSAQLLQHPFLTGVRRTCSDVVFSKNPSAPLSPTSVLEVGNGSSSSSSSVVLSSSLLQNSIPPLSPPRLWRISAAFQSPTRRAAAGKRSEEEAAACEETGNSSSKDWWRSTSPPAEGEWIVVRSPKAATNCPVVPHKKFESKFESYYNEEEEPTDSEMMATSILQKPRPLMMRQSQRQQQEASIIFYSSSSASTPDEEEEEEVLKKEKLMGSSISSTARQLSTTTTIMMMQEYPIPQEQYKPPSSKPCSISSSSSISCSPRRSPPNSAMPEKHPPPLKEAPPYSAATCDIFHKKIWHSNLLMQQQQMMMMMMQKKIISEADLLSSNIGDSTEDCHGNNFFFFFSLSMDATQGAGSFNKAFHAQGEVVVHQKKRWRWWKRQLRRLFPNSLEKYLQWLSAYDHLRLATTQGHLHCNVVPWIVNKNNCCSSRLQFHQNEFFVLSCVVISLVFVCVVIELFSLVCVMIWLLCPKAFSTTPLFLFSCLLSKLQMVFKHGFSSFLLELGFEFTLVFLASFLSVANGFGFTLFFLSFFLSVANGFSNIVFLSFFQLQMGFQTLFFFLSFSCKWVFKHCFSFFLSVVNGFSNVIFFSFFCKWV
jgi:serine/threonine protein kinase